MGLFGRRKRKGGSESGGSSAAMTGGESSEYQSPSEAEIEAANVKIKAKVKPAGNARVEGDNWWCAVCTQKQQFSKAKCKTCGRFPRWDPDSVVADTAWTCPVCTQENQYKCKTCGRVPKLPPPPSPEPEEPAAAAAPAGGARPQPNVQQHTPCALCGKAARQPCPRCRRVFYCGSDCYRSHWQTHGPECMAAPSPSVSRPGTPPPVAGAAAEVPHGQTPPAATSSAQATEYVSTADQLLAQPTAPNAMRAYQLCAQALTALLPDKHGAFWVAANALGAQAMLLVQAGSNNAAAAEQCARRAVDSPHGGQFWNARAHVAMGLAMLARNSPDAAVQHLQQALTSFGGSQGLPMAEAKVAMAEAHLLKGVPERAGALAAEAVLAAKQAGSKWLWAQANALQARAMLAMPGQDVSAAVLQLQTALTVLDANSSPVQWLPNAMALARALLRRGDGDDDVRMGVMLVTGAAQLYAAAKQPVQWGRASVLQGDLLQCASSGADPEQLLRAYGNALQCFNPQQLPAEYADCCTKLGSAFRCRTQGDRVQNVEAAVHHLRLAMNAAQGSAWARAAVVLAETLDVRPSGSREENQAESLSLLRRAVEAFAADPDPAVRREWAQTAMHLSAVLQRTDTDVAEAARLYSEAQAVFPVTTSPREWALCALGSGECLLALGDAAPAADHLEEALSMLSHEDAPNEWARAHLGLARAYMLRRKPGSSDVLDAVSLLTASTRVFARERRPADWAAVQRALGDAYALLGRNDEAQRAYEAALPAAPPAARADVHLAMAALAEASEESAEAALHVVRAAETAAPAGSERWGELLARAGRLYAGAQKWQPAADCLQQAVDRLDAASPVRAAAAIALAQVLLQRQRDPGDVDTALALLNGAMDASQRSAAWAEAMAAAGVAHAVRSSGLHALNAAAATACFEEVLEVEVPPLLRAATQLKLALHIVAERPEDAMTLELEATEVAAPRWGKADEDVEPLYALAASLAVRLAEVQPESASGHLHRAVVHSERACAAVLAARLPVADITFDAIRERAAGRTVCYLTGTHDEATTVVMSARGGVKAWRSSLVGLDRSLQQLDAGNAAALPALAKALAVTGWTCSGAVLVVSGARLWRVPVAALPMTDGRPVGRAVESITRVPSVVALPLLEADYGCTGVHVVTHDNRQWADAALVAGLRRCGVGVVRGAGSLVVQPTGHRREAVAALLAGADAVLCCDRPEALPAAVLVFGRAARACCAAPADAVPARVLHAAVAWVREAQPSELRAAAAELHVPPPPLPVSDLTLANLVVVGTGRVRVAADDTSSSPRRRSRVAQQAMEAAEVVAASPAAGAGRRLVVVPAAAPGSGSGSAPAPAPAPEPEPAAAPAPPAVRLAPPPADDSKKALLVAAARKAGKKAIRRMSAASMLITAHNVSSTLLSGMPSDVAREFERAMTLIQQEDEAASEQAADILERIGPQLPPALRKQVFGVGSEARAAIRDALKKAKKARALLRAATSSSAPSDVESKRAGIETAIQLLEEAMRVLTREAFAKRFAGLSHDLGSAYACRLSGDAAENAESAVRHLQNAVDVRSRAKSAAPVPWASSCSALASALARRVRGQKDANLEEAIRYWRSALEIYTKATAPDKWARVVGRLGVAYDSRTRGDRAENTAMAVQLFEDALSVYAQARESAAWATTTLNLAVAVEASDPERAVALYNDVLAVTDRERQPLRWARCTACLAVALQTKGDVDEAVRLYRGAVEVLGELKGEAPNEWASATLNLGTALAHRGEHDEALQLFRDALAVLTPTAAPEEWARAASATAASMLSRTQGDRADNVETAVGLLEKVLALVYDRDRFPEQWAATHASLGRLYGRLRARGAPADNARQGAEHARLALQVYTPGDHAAHHAVAAALLADLLPESEAAEALALMRGVTETVGRLGGATTSAAAATAELRDVGTSAALFLAAHKDTPDAEVGAWLQQARSAATPEHEAEVADLAHWLEELHGERTPRWVAQAARVRTQVGGHGEAPAPRASPLMALGMSSSDLTSAAAAAVSSGSARSLPPQRTAKKLIVPKRQRRKSNIGNKAAMEALAMAAQRSPESPPRSRSASRDSPLSRSRSNSRDSPRTRSRSSSRDRPTSIAAKAAQEAAMLQAARTGGDSPQSGSPRSPRSRSSSKTSSTAGTPPSPARRMRRASVTRTGALRDLSGGEAAAAPAPAPSSAPPRTRRASVARGTAMRDMKAAMASAAAGVAGSAVDSPSAAAGSAVDSPAPASAAAGSAVDSPAPKPAPPAESPAAVDSPAPQPAPPVDSPRLPTPPSEKEEEDQGEPNIALHPATEPAVHTMPPTATLVAADPAAAAAQQQAEAETTDEPETILAGGDGGRGVRDDEMLDGVATVVAPEDESESSARAREAVGLLRDAWAERGEGVERALELLSAALAECDADEFPMAWASFSVNIGVAWHARSGGDRSENLEQAIAHYTGALKVLAGQGRARDWARGATNLAAAYRVRPAGSARRNLARSEALLRAAVAESAAGTLDWCRATVNLATTLCAMCPRRSAVAASAVGRREGDESIGRLREAIQLFEQALAEPLLRREGALRGATCLNLAVALMELPPRAELLERAVSLCSQAMDAFGEGCPVQRARAQVNLGVATQGRLRGERAANVEQAIALYESAIPPLRPDPSAWAHAHMNLASALCARTAGNRGSNVEQALQHLLQSVKVFRPAAFPESWAAAMVAMGSAYFHRRAGDRRANLAEARRLWVDALQVFTREEYAAEWGRLQGYLQLLG